MECIRVREDGSGRKAALDGREQEGLCALGRDCGLCMGRKSPV